MLWRLSRACLLEHEGAYLDLHWGIHARGLPAVFLRSLERELWNRARRRDDGVYEPRIESLTVYLAVHAAGHHFGRPGWVDSVHRAAAMVDDWDEVWRAAPRRHVEGALAGAMQG